MKKVPYVNTESLILRKAPASGRGTLIVKHLYSYPGQYASFYHQSAKRLADSFSGEPADDEILLPFLFLYRQAIELKLKHLISFLAKIRISYVDGHAPDLTRLRDPDHLKTRFGHNLHKLLNELKTQYEALALEQTFRKETEELIMAFHQDDRGSFAFRYEGELPPFQQNADFLALAQWLDNEFDLLSLIEDAVEGIYDAAPTLAELEAEYADSGY